MKLSSLLFLFLISIGLSANTFAKAPLKQINFSASELQNIGGHYSTVYGYIYIQVNGKQVSTHVDGKYIQLIKKSDGRMYPRYKLLKLFPISLGDMSFSLMRNKGKQQIRMHYKDKHNKKPSTKIVAQKFTPTAVPSLWKTRLGKYKATLLKGKSKIRNIRLAMKRGVMVAFINKIQNPYPLLALSSSRLFSPSAGHNQDQKINIANNNKKMMLNYGKNSLLLNKL